MTAEEGSVPSRSVARQACTVVLPSSGAFDSRAWRIARTLAGRGHDVTIVARSEDGLPDHEAHPDGYRIVRVPVSAVTGLPGPLRAVVGRLRGGAPSGRAAALADRPDPDGAPGKASGRGPIGRFRAAVAGVRRLLAIGLTVRSQTMAARRAAPRADLVHAMAYMGIPIGLALGRRDRAAVVYDARDIYVDARNIARLPAFARRLFAAIARRWARQADRVMTVNRAYADVMAERFRVRLPAIVMNCSYRREHGEPGRLFHESLGLARDGRVVLYHGGLSPDRGIEQLVGALAFLPASVHAVFLGYGPLQGLLEESAGDAGLAGRLHVLRAVPPTELLDWVGSADVVAMPIQGTTLNHRLTTPNKLFEAMAVGVPVVASDLPGMAAIVEGTGCGILCDPADPTDIARAIRALLDATPEERAARRSRTLAAAQGTYSWEAQAEVLLEEYRRLTGRPW